MTRSYSRSILRNVPQQLRPSVSSSITDAQLLERFLHDGDDAAFELLTVQRGFPDSR